MKTIVKYIVGFGAVCLLSAQTPDAPIKIGDVTVFGSLRDRVYDWNWFTPTSGRNDYVYSGDYLRVGLSRKLATWDWTAEFAIPFMLALPTNATGTGPQQGGLGLGSNYYSANGNNSTPVMIFPKQLFVRLDQLGGNTHESLRLGRFEFNDGTELKPKNETLAFLKDNRLLARLIGTFGFSDVGRSFDGVQYVYAGAKDNFTFVGATPTRGVFQVDGWGWNRIGFGYAAYTHQWGSGRHSADSRAFVIEYEDFRHIVKTDNRPLAVRKLDLANIRMETFGGHTVHAFTTDAATFDVLAWGAGQTGRWGYQKQRSGAIDVEAGVQPNVLPALKPWFRGGYSWTSGDSNPNDNTHGTFFQLLPTPRIYARFPFFNMMNNVDAFGSMTLRPSKKITIVSEAHSLRLSNANDLWYAGGGVFQPWTFGYTGRSTSGARSLGNLYDTSLEFRPTRKLTLTGYFGYLQGLAVMEKIYPRGKDGKFGYIEALFRF